jgi:hypothetical protein
VRQSSKEVGGGASFRHIFDHFSLQLKDFNHNKNLLMFPRWGLGECNVLPYHLEMLFFRPPLFLILLVVILLRQLWTQSSLLF